jgi:hypothetical protein
MRSQSGAWIVAAVLAACSEGGPISGAQDLGSRDQRGAGADLGGSDLASQSPDFGAFDLAQIASDLGLPDAPFDGPPFDAPPSDGFFSDGAVLGDLGFPSDLAPFNDSGPAGDGFNGPDGNGGGDASMGCQMMMGAGGPNGQCIGEGICNNHVYEIDCNGATCTCSIDMVATGSFVEINGTCNNLVQAWAQDCRF